MVSRHVSVPVCGKAADAARLGRVHGRGAGQAQNPQPEAKAYSRVPVRVGVHLGAGSGDGYGRRGALGRSEKREAVAASSCDGLLHVHVCGPFLLPIFRWGIDSSSSFALSIWEGDRHGSQEEETHPAPLSTSAEGLAVKGVIMPRSGQTALTLHSFRPWPPMSAVSFFPFVSASVKQLAGL